MFYHGFPESIERVFCNFTTNMKYTDKPLAQVVISLCKEAQIQHIVISPGSRNAPLALGFVNDPFFKIYSVVDERCAGFFALGIAQQMPKPVALVCTSGSALLNYYPAISEAYYSRLILSISATDKPSVKRMFMPITLVFLPIYWIVKMF